MAACTSCGAESPDAARFCSACGKPLRPQRRGEERRQITAVFIDVVDSTSVAEGLDPEDVLARLDPFFELARRELEAHGGFVEKFIGDAVVAIFGAPVSTEHDCERAVTAALRICDAVPRLDSPDGVPPLRIRVGVASGEALVDVDVRPEDWRGMAWGDILNTASRIQGAAPPGRVLVDERTYRRCRHRIEFELSESINARGKREPVAVWLAAGTAQEDAGEQATPFVGRADELALLGQAFAAVCSERRGRGVVLVGEPGVGKTRLVARATAAMPEALVVRGRCLDYGAGMTYAPIAEMARSVAGIRYSDPPEAVAERIASFVGQLPDEQADAAEGISVALRHVLGAGRSEPIGRLSTPGQAELQWGLLRTLELLARDRPVVLLFEDLHWAEPALVEIVAAFAAVEAPVLTIATTRPPGELALPGERIVLEPLQDDASEELLESVLASADVVLEPEVGEHLLARAAGNPLYLAEMTHVLVAASARGETIDLDSLPVADSLQALVGARLDTLPGGPRRLLQTVAVMGEVIWSGAAERLAGDGDDLEPAFGELERSGVLQRRLRSSMAGEREWTFSHVVLRDVAYQRVPIAQRVQLHSRFADWMAELDSASDLVELEAFHLERACQLAGGLSMRSAEPPTQRAVGALIRASQRAEHRRGLREARSYAERALSLAPPDDGRLAIGARLSLARSELWVGVLDAADTDLRAVAAEAARLGLPEVECEAHALLADVAMKQDRLADARAFLVRARQLAERFGDHPLRVLTAFEEASLGDYEGRFDESLDKLEAAIAVAASLDAVDLLSEGHLRRGMLLANCGRLVEADRELELCSEAAAGTGSVHDDARAAFARAQVQHHLGQLESSEALALRAEAWFERTDTTNMRVQNLFLLARHARRRGDLERAEEVLADALGLTERAADWLQYEARRLLVEHLVIEGRMPEARELVRHVESGNDAEPRGYSAVAWSLTRAAIAFGDGYVALGRELCERALDDLAGMNLPADLSSARLGYARLLRLSGDVQAARQQIAHARAALADVDAPGLVTEVDDADALLG